MSRKRIITEEMLIEKALELAEKNGLAKLSCRELAASVPCSTYPIYQQFGAMDKLKEQVCQRLCLEVFTKVLDAPKSIEALEAGLCAFNALDSREFERTILDAVVGRYFYERYFVPLFSLEYQGRYPSEKALERACFLRYATCVGRAVVRRNFGLAEVGAFLEPA